MADDFQELLNSLHACGYSTITRDKGYDKEASGVVPLNPEDCREKPSGWRRFLPQIYNAGDIDLVPSDIRYIVDAHGFRVEPVGRDADSLTVLIQLDLAQ